MDSGDVSYDSIDDFDNQFMNKNVKKFGIMKNENKKQESLDV